MKAMPLFLLFLFSSCNIFSSKVDMSEYLFSNKERKWSIEHPTMPEAKQTFLHQPFTENDKKFVKVTSVLNGKKMIQTYEIKDETIDLIYDYRDGWGEKKEIHQKPWPRFVSVGEEVHQHKHSGQILMQKDDSTSLGESVFKHEIIEIAAPGSTHEDVYIYAKGVGLINRFQRFKVPSASGEPIPNEETRIVLDGLNWVTCKAQECSIVK